jgi:hypothetical protein
MPTFKCVGATVWLRINGGSFIPYLCVSVAPWINSGLFLPGQPVHPRTRPSVLGPTPTDTALGVKAFKSSTISDTEAFALASCFSVRFINLLASFSSFLVQII